MSGRRVSSFLCAEGASDSAFPRPRRWLRRLEVEERQGNASGWPLQVSPADWLQSGALGYVDGLSLYQAYRGRPISGSDPRGLASLEAGFMDVPGFLDAIQTLEDSHSQQLQQQIAAIDPDMIANPNDYQDVHFIGGQRPTGDFYDAYTFLRLTCPETQKTIKAFTVHWEDRDGNPVAGLHGGSYIEELRSDFPDIHGLTLSAELLDQVLPEAAADARIDPQIRAVTTIWLCCGRCDRDALGDPILENENISAWELNDLRALKCDGELKKMVIDFTFTRSRHTNEIHLGMGYVEELHTVERG